MFMCGEGEMGEGMSDIHANILQENLKGKQKLEYVGVDGRIKLKGNLIT
jgi:hypothetical protein